MRGSPGSHARGEGGASVTCARISADVPLVPTALLRPVGVSTSAGDRPAERGL